MRKPNDTQNYNWNWKKEITIEQKKSVILNSGELMFKFNLCDSTLFFSYQYNNSHLSLKRQTPQLCKIQTQNSESVQIRLKPALSEVPIVIRTDDILRVQPKQVLKGYAIIPATIVLSLKENGDSEIFRGASKFLSKTWIGDSTIEGHMGVMVKNSIMLDLNLDHYEKHHIICPFSIENADTDPLSIQRFNITPQNMAIYSADEKLYSSHLKIKYFGKEKTSQITPESLSEKHFTKSPELLMPASQKEQNLAVRTFQRVKTLSFLGS